MRTLLLAAALAPASPLHAMPACPSAWRLDFWAPAEGWPEVERVADPGLLHDMVRELYEECPRGEAGDALLLAAAERFLRMTGRDPDQAHARQEVRFRAGMTLALGAGDYDRDDRRADAALAHLIEVNDRELRRRAMPQVQALRLRRARKALYIAYYVERNARNRGKAGWRGASQRLRCYLSEYPDTTADEVNRPRLDRLLEAARDFIHDHEGDGRYDLAGMRALAAELQRAVAAPAARPERWPTAADLDPAAPGAPRDCHRRPSPIPGPEGFDFDFTPEGAGHRRIELKKARERAEALLSVPLP